MLAILLSGLALGGVYTLVAIGFNTIWLTTRAVNFAQGAFVVAGMFLTVALYNRGVSVPVTFLILVIVGGTLSALLYLLGIKPVQERGDHAELVITVGALTVIQGVLLVLVTDNVQRVESLFPDTLVPVPGGFVAPSGIAIIILAVVVSLLAHAWTRRTKSGLAALGVSEDREAAVILGVNTARLSFFAFVTAGALGFAIAPFVGPKVFAAVTLATILTIKGFIALAIGGLGSNVGALIGGFGIGFLELLVASQFDTAWQNAAVFAVFLLTMWVRPRGLFGVARERAV